MSLSYQPLKPILVKDPVVMVDHERDYAILQSGKQIMWKGFTSTSISQSSIQFSCPPPSGSIIVDRKQYFTLPIRLTFTAPGTGAHNILNAYHDAPRAYPLSSSIDTLQVTINNTSVSINMADIIQPLLHYNTDAKLKEYDYSMTPTAPDQTQNYSDNGAVAVRNPLGFYGDSLDESVMGRGGFPYVIRVNTPTLAIVDMVVTEPLFLSPFYWGKYNSCGFANVNTMDFNISFLNNSGYRMWSHDAAYDAGNPISSITTQFNGFSSPGFAFPTTQSAPQMLFKYITPHDNEMIPFNMPLTFPYFDITRFPTDYNNSIAFSASAVGAGATLTSNNMQLSSIPWRMYIFARPSNSVLYNSASYSDTFYGISNVNIQFNNQTGILSSATQQQLYEMSVKNHLNNNWTQFFGITELTNVFPSGGSTSVPFNISSAYQFGTIGSVICCEFGTDIPLGDLEAPGLNGQFQLLVQANVYNCDPTGAHDELDVTLYIVIVSEGTFTIPALGKSMTQLGVISRQDIINAKQSIFLNYKDVQEVNGGNFLSGLKDFGKKLFSGLRENKTISKLLTSAQALPPPYGELAMIGAPIASALGFGEGEGEGEGSWYGDHRGHSRAAKKGWKTRRGEGVNVGGAMLDRRMLKDRLKY